MSARNMSMMGRVVPGMVLGFLVLLVLILLGDMNEVTSGLRVYDWRYFLLVLLLTLFIYIIRIFKWHFSLGRIGLKRLSFANSAQVFMAAFPLTVSQGKIAKVLKGIWLNKKSGLPVGRSGQVLAADQVSDWLALLALFILGVIAYPAYWPVFLFVLAAALVLLILIRAEVSLDFWDARRHLLVGRRRCACT
jgi:glycosyltransferase 2 family protein